jgi:hypothetical protein
MLSIKFADGMEIQIDGGYRVTSKSDGLYIVSYGMCIPVDNSEDAEELLETLKSQ